MPYVDLSDLTGEIPLQFLTQGLDDDNDGAIDAWEEVQAKSCKDVDDLLEARFPVPITLSPLPGVLKSAAIAFACYRIYRRRSTPDRDNPFYETAKAFKKTLGLIASGEVKLSALPNSDAVAVDPPGAIIVHDSALGAPGRMLG